MGENDTTPEPKIGAPVGPADGQDGVPAVSYEELIATPISEEEARIKLAECDIQLARCQKERAMIDQQIADIAWIRTIVLRQVLNRPPAPQEGQDA